VKNERERERESVFERERHGDVVGGIL